MQTFRTLSASQSKDIDIFLFRNASNLKKDARLILFHSQSHSRATSLLVLSLEETVKAILVKLHSEGFNVYSLKDAGKFFRDHRVRHQIAQLIEMGSGLLESHLKWKELRKKEQPTRISWLNGILNLVSSSPSLLRSFQRISSLESFNDYKNNGLYVDYKNKILVPEEQVTEIEFETAQEILERTRRFYKALKIVHHPMIKNCNDERELQEKKEELKEFINEALDGYRFEHK